MARKARLLRSGLAIGLAQRLTEFDIRPLQAANLARGVSLNASNPERYSRLDLLLSLNRQDPTARKRHAARPAVNIYVDIYLQIRRTGYTFLYDYRRHVPWHS